MNKMLVLKALIISGLTVVILIALFFVNSVISDRERYREEAVQSIEASYAGPQTITGPVLVRPYTQTTMVEEKDDKGVKKLVEHKDEQDDLVFPHDYRVTGVLEPSERRHGLYKVTVFEFAAHVMGELDATEPKLEGTIVWGEPYLAMSVQDVRGIVGSPTMTVNGSARTMVQTGSELIGWKPNLKVLLPATNGAFQGHLAYDLRMNLAGTEMLAVVPVGDSNRVEMSSRWPSPLFAGEFLPRTRDVSKNGFTAEWELSSLASSAQVQMATAGAAKIDEVNVSLLTPIDPYKLSDRATKYGILFVVLTFGGFFLFEIMRQLPIHPVQYLLVGLALVIFFLLLISFSEHMAFAQAYLIASAASIGLLTFYLSYVLRTSARGLGFGGLLVLLYAAVYGLLISEDNALVLGSLLLFGLLAVVMFITRKVDWYRGSAELMKVKAANEREYVGTPPPPLQKKI